jgi:peptidoglycan/xylan/chitin deacetylase (PgdA/CDA1 family)
MLISRAMLEQQLDWIGRRYRYVSLDELGSRLESGAGTEGLAAVSFDDGYRDVYENAFPLLRRKGIPAAIFVVTDLLGSDEPPLHDRLYLLVARALQAGPSTSAGASRLFEALRVASARAAAVVGAPMDPFTVLALLLDGLSQAEALDLARALSAELGQPEDDLRAISPLSFEMLAEMQSAGITIGSHTRSHPLLTNEGELKLADETAGSRAVLERALGTPVHHFAYPGGRWSDKVVDAVKAAGYRFAFTTCLHRNPRHPLLTIPRTLLWERSCSDSRGQFSPNVMSCHARGVFGLVVPCRSSHVGQELGPAA